MAERHHEEKPRGRRAVWRSVSRAAALLVTALFVALLAWGTFTQAPNNGIDESLARSESAPAPRFELGVFADGSLGPLRSRIGPALGDGRLALEELRGMPVVLNFWASWCVPCRTEAPLLERTWREQRGRGVLFLGLNMQDATAEGRAFLREFDVSYLNVRESGNSVARRWGVTGLPETFFISSVGRVVGHVIGAASAEQLAVGVAAARAGRPQAARQGGDRRRTR